MSSAQLRCVETAGFGEFWVNFGEFSIFWSFMMKLGDVGRVLNDDLAGDNTGELEEVKDNVLGVKSAGSGGFLLKMGDFW